MSFAWSIPLWWPGFLVGVLFFFLAWLLRKRPEAAVEDPYPYARREKLFTPAERFFLAVLHRVLPTRCVVLGKVRMADVLKTRPGLPPESKTAAFNRIVGKHFDFVLCDAVTLAIVGVIELDDASHRQAKRQERDAFVNEACAAAGLPLLRVPVQRQYDVARLKHVLTETFFRPPPDVRKPD